MSNRTQTGAVREMITMRDFMDPMFDEMFSRQMGFSEEVEMPVYGFVCPTCGTRFDERLSFQEDVHEAVCPKCHSSARRVFRRLR